jgi:hypothetical protein
MRVSPPSSTACGGFENKGDSSGADERKKKKKRMKSKMTTTTRLPETEEVACGFLQREREREGEEKREREGERKSHVYPQGRPPRGKKFKKHPRRA